MVLLYVSFFVRFYCVLQIRKQNVFGLGRRESPDLPEAARDHAQEGPSGPEATPGGGLQQR